MDSVSIGHNKVLAIVMLLCGGSCLALGLVAATWSSVLVGCIVSAVAFAQLFGTVAVVHEREIELKNVLGMTLKRVQYPNRAALSVENGSVFAEVEGQRKKVLGGFTVDKGDVAKLQSWLGA